MIQQNADVDILVTSHELAGAGGWGGIRSVKTITHGHFKISKHSKYFEKMHMSDVKHMTLNGAFRTQTNLAFCGIDKMLQSLLHHIYQLNEM